MTLNTVSTKPRSTMRNFLLVPLLAPPSSFAYHDCVEAAQVSRRKVRSVNNDGGERAGSNPSSCSGGLCLGMKDGPHEGGPASYPVAFDSNLLVGTTVHSRMTVPALPALTDGITYYVWTDIFFGDGGLGRMNQLVPQLILGSALDGSSGPPDYEPSWGHHELWSFGAHYFFETLDVASNNTVAHAAYGDLYPTSPGEVLWTEFRLEGGGDGMDAASPRWVLQMGVEGDPARTSTLAVDRPYMGLGADPSWGSERTYSWTEKPYHRMCINACWELYGADDAAHLPSSGSTYEITVVQPRPDTFPFLAEWEQDEGGVGGCPSSTVTEQHDESAQHIEWNINVDPLYGSGSNSEFHRWKESYVSTFERYKHDEGFRRKIFEDNLLRLKWRGDNFSLDETAILTADEFRELGKASCSPSSFHAPDTIENHSLRNEERNKFHCSKLAREHFPLSKDTRWRDAFVHEIEIDYRGTQSTPVKNQGKFGTCWSFGFVETVEGLGVRQGHALQNVSNQEVIDCCAGCRGSAQDASFGFVLRDGTVHGRLATESAYPYRGSPGNCTSASVRRRDLAPAKVGGCLRVSDDDVKSGDPILFALSNLGPASFGIDSSCLQGYKGGVITNCTNARVNHEVLLVGAGTDSGTGVPYFRAKNSWGHKWGEEGYFRFSRSGGQLGVGSVIFATSSMESAATEAA